MKSTEIHSALTRMLQIHVGKTDQINTEHSQADEYFSLITQYQHFSETISVSTLTNIMSNIFNIFEPLGRPMTEEEHAEIMELYALWLTEQSSYLRSENQFTLHNEQSTTDLRGNMSRALSRGISTVSNNYDTYNNSHFIHDNLHSTVQIPYKLFEVWFVQLGKQLALCAQRQREQEFDLENHIEYVLTDHNIHSTDPEEDGITCNLQ